MNKPVISLRRMPRNVEIVPGDAVHGSRFDLSLAPPKLPLLGG